MKKLILKTAFITLGVLVIISISLFGIMSFCAPAVMMDLTASLGLEYVSGDYAYQAYQRTSEIDYLARAFEIAAEYKKDQIADERFEELIAHENFDAYCDEQNPGGFEYSETATLRVNYRESVFGDGVCVKYRLACVAVCSEEEKEERKEEIYQYALSETDSAFNPCNPVLKLAVEAADREDAAFCSFLLQTIPMANLTPNEDYENIINFLEEIC